MRLLEGIAADLLDPPINILRAMLHPEGLASHVVNLAEWRTYTFRHLEREIGLTDDPLLRDLLKELSAYSYHNPTGAVGATKPPAQPTYTGLVIRLQLALRGSVLSFFSASTIFGTPADITLA